MRVVQTRTLQARPIVAGALRLTPESRVVAVRLPFGGLVWQRPTAVVVEQPGVATRRLPIIDLTRRAQLGVLLGTVVLTVVCLIVASHPQESYAVHA
ncbi:MAG TPA: hypothetical protein VKV73_14865 [Chloroflexota bacterium]|nr:hypothetical protein [Chloroflexota bacterium]